MSTERGQPHFRAVIVYADGDGPKLSGVLREAAALVDVGPDPHVWVEADRLKAFRFICAGFAAETALVGHAIDGAFEHDFNVWRVGAGATQPMNEMQVDEAIGAHFQDIIDETDEWAAQNAKRIFTLANLLGTLTPTAEVSYDEVVQLLSQSEVVAVSGDEFE